MRYTNRRLLYFTLLYYIEPRKLNSFAYLIAKSAFNFVHISKIYLGKALSAARFPDKKEGGDPSMNPPLVHELSISGK